MHAADITGKLTVSFYHKCHNKLLYHVDNPAVIEVFP